MWFIGKRGFFNFFESSIAKFAVKIKQGGKPGPAEYEIKSISFLSILSKTFSKIFLAFFSKYFAASCGIIPFPFGGV
jgi:hypothetical protein